MQEGVAPLQVGVKSFNGLGHEVGARENVNRKNLRCREQLAICGHNGTRKVAGDVEHARAAGAQQGIRHLARDSLQPIVQQRKPHAVGGKLLVRDAHAALHLLRLRAGRDWPSCRTDGAPPLNREAARQPSPRTRRSPALPGFALSPSSRTGTRALRHGRGPENRLRARSCKDRRPGASRVCPSSSSAVGRLRWPSNSRSRQARWDR